ncbi:N-acetylglucosamine-6-phosphate deacetylase [Primorskyibacter sp. S187A]|uniref:N-acetylglucosamine-6-phosphate deacetylase n=1 Tax=Primorskyibacter sp. S187A TaxID=3415130 RepID=UPI003C79FE87
MSQPESAFVGADIFDGERLQTGKALAIWADGTCQIVAETNLPVDLPRHLLPGGTITPGFVDLQVNGGGGRMFNDDPSCETLAIMAEAHRRGGTIALLPTLITDTPARTAAAIDAAERAMDARIPGIVGLHLEGPHLSVARKGAHDPNLIRTMEADDLAALLGAAERLPNLLVTIAPESVTPAQIHKMRDAGIIVSLGHTDASYDTCMHAFEAGASMATHLFNAMSQLTNREPGLVGAALARDDVFAGVIADGIHVHPVSLRLALEAKSEPDRLFLVTDAMATAGSEITSFQLNGRRVLRQDQRLTLEDGTLAGADLALPRALQVMTEQVGDPLERALARATRTPASLLRAPGRLGTWPQNLSDLMYLSGGLTQVCALADAPSRP